MLALPAPRLAQVPEVRIAALRKLLYRRATSLAARCDCEIKPCCRGDKPAPLTPPLFLSPAHRRSYVPPAGDPRQVSGQSDAVKRRFFTAEPVAALELVVCIVSLQYFPGLPSIELLDLREQR